MEHLSRRLTAWKILIIEVGLFVVFLLTFGEFLVKKVWVVIGPLLP
ncbi:MAG: hypothetical protein ABI603_04280 [Acidobacteriota bacterium]